MSWFLFPGQGSQAPGMGRDFYGGAPECRETFDEAAAVLGQDFLETIFDGDADALRDTRIAQPALVTVGVAIARHLQARGVTPSGCAGHSIGEIPALVVAECIAFDDALRLTRERARLMAEDSSGGGMAAVLGLPPEAIEAALPEGVEIANYNGPQQTIISGSKSGIEAAIGALKSVGAKRVLPLNVSGPFHSSFMEAAGQSLRVFLEDITIADPALPVVSSVSGARETSGEAIRELLWRQLAQPVRWTDVMRTIGPAPAYELGPGNVLQGLAKRTEGAPHITPAGVLENLQAASANS